MAKRKEGHAGRRQDRDKRALMRRAPSRLPKRRILIVGDGEKTEPFHFRGLRDRDDVSRKFRVVVKAGKGGSALNSVKKAIEEKKSDRSYDEVWCVVDAEDQAHRSTLDKARGLAKKEDIRIALSCPCFEVWLLAHFEKSARCMHDAQDVIHRLCRVWQREFGIQYDRTAEDVYRRLSDRTDTAISNAREVREVHFQSEDDTADCNSSTDVYRLVDLLVHQK